MISTSSFIIGEISLFHGSLLRRAAALRVGPNNHSAPLGSLETLMLNPDVIGMMLLTGL